MDEYARIRASAYANGRRLRHVAVPLLKNLRDGRAVAKDPHWSLEMKMRSATYVRGFVDGWCL